MASGILSFAVMVMSLALITCSNDDKEEHQILQPKPNTTILDGVDKPVLQAVCQDEGLLSLPHPLCRWQGKDGTPIKQGITYERPRYQAH